MRSVTVVTDKQGIDHYYYDDQCTNENYNDKTSMRKYACLTDALEDSEPYRNEHYSDGECLDYILGVLKQLEGRIGNDNLSEN